MKLKINKDRKGLEELRDEIAMVIQSIPQITKSFENQENEKVYAMLAKFLETVGIFADLFSEDIGWNFGNTLQTTKELNENLERATTQLIAAQENKFWVSICDIVEFEIQPILENWWRIAEATIAALPPTTNTPTA